MKGGGIEVRDVQDWIAVKRLHKNGISKQRIAKELHMARNTVKKLIRSDEEPKYVGQITKARLIHIKI